MSIGSKSRIDAFVRIGIASPCIANPFSLSLAGFHLISSIELIVCFRMGDSLPHLPIVDPLLPLLSLLSLCADCRNTRNNENEINLRCVFITFDIDFRMKINWLQLSPLSGCRAALRRRRRWLWRACFFGQMGDFCRYRSNGTLPLYLGLISAEYRDNEGTGRHAAIIAIAECRVEKVTPARSFGLLRSRDAVLLIKNWTLRNC